MRSIGDEVLGKSGSVTVLNKDQEYNSSFKIEGRSYWYFVLFVMIEILIIFLFFRIYGKGNNLIFGYDPIEWFTLISIQIALFIGFSFVPFRKVIEIDDSYFKYSSSKKELKIIPLETLKEIGTFSEETPWYVYIMPSKYVPPTKYKGIYIIYTPYSFPVKLKFYDDSIFNVKRLKKILNQLSIYSKKYSFRINDNLNWLANKP